MARTATEKRIIESRNAKGILVPILQEVLEHEVRVEDDDDIAFMVDLMQARARPREDGVFSPSMLGSCMRQAYFAKTGMTKHPAHSPRSNFYFLDGDFRHYKWQFALWKAHRAGLLNLLGVELRVYHPAGDFAGTIDALVEQDKVRVTDFKGMHVRSFQTFETHGTPDNYKVQSVGYAEILNRNGGVYAGFMGSGTLDEEIESVLLIGENKGGPTQRGSSQIALHEDIIPVRRGRSIVKRRMRALRGYVEREEVPPPACTSTRIKQFEECPFAPQCREEVKAVQAQREKTVRPKRKLRINKPSR